MAPAVLPAFWEVAGDPEGAFSPATVAGPETGTAWEAAEDEEGELGVAVEVAAVTVVAVEVVRSCLDTTSTDSLKW